jgi:Carboxylesterase family
VSFIIVYSFTGSWRFREPQLPSYTPGVQLANKQPSECLQAGVGLAPKTPFRNTVLDTSPTRRLETRSVNSTELTGSEDCLFFKYIFELIDMYDMLTTTVVPVSTFLVAWEKKRTFRLSSGYMGIYYLLLSTNFSLIIFFLFARGGYVEGNASQFNGNDLVREAGGGVVAVIIQYRLGVFGFLPGEKVKEGGALNAGLCKYLDCEKTVP